MRRRGHESNDTVLARLERRMRQGDLARADDRLSRSIRHKVTQKGRTEAVGRARPVRRRDHRLRPLPRGEGFKFEDKITAARSAAVDPGGRARVKVQAKGPLGFPVVDVAVTLTDAATQRRFQRLSFRMAGRIAMSEALAAAAPHLLERSKMTVVTPPIRPAG